MNIMVIKFKIQSQRYNLFFSTPSLYFFFYCLCASFPFSDPKRLEEWIRAVSRESKKGDQWRPTQFSRICSDHFNDDDYVEGTKIKTLRSNAVPFQSPTRLLHKQPAVKTPVIFIIHFLLTSTLFSIVFYFMMQ